MLPILLLTRPEPQARRFAARAKAVLPPHEPVIAPLSRVVSRPFDQAVFEGITGLVLTSANAVPSLPPLPPLPAWCVGPATAAAARAAGFDARDGGGDAAALIETLTDARPRGPLLHAHGTHLARDLVKALRPRGVDLRSVAVYEALACDWSQPVLARLASAARVIAPLFSPRAADRLVHNLAQVDGLSPDSVTCVAISAACAKRLPDALGARCLTATRPETESLIATLREALSHRGPFA